MTDVVEQGRPDRGPQLPPWARRAALVTAVIVVAVLAFQTGVLFGDGSSRPDRRTGPTVTTTGDAEDTRYVVVRDGQLVVRYDAFGVAPGPRLPPDLSADSDLYVVADGGDRARLLTVAGGQLLRVEPGRERLADLGAVTRIVDASTRPGEVFVQTSADEGAQVVTVDAATGQVIDPVPFADDARRKDYVPVGVVSQFGVEGLVLRRSGPAGEGGDDLAVAWATGEVRAGHRPAFQPVGRHGRLLGLTDDWLLLLDGSCPGRACRLVIVNFGPESSTVREVLPPRGWSFAAPEAARRTRSALVPVVRPAGQPGESSTALARLAAGGERALLVAQSEGVMHGAGMVDGSGGDVFFVRLGADGIRRVVRWQPDRPGEAKALGDIPPLPESARLVCVCDTTRGGTDVSTEP